MNTVHDSFAGGALSENDKLAEGTTLHAPCLPQAQNEDTKRQLRKKEENIILPVVKKAILQMNMSQHTTETMVEEFRKLLNSMVRPETIHLHFQTSTQCAFSACMPSGVTQPGLLEPLRCVNLF